MPTVNIYYTADKHEAIVLSHIDELKKLIAEQLTGRDIKLGPGEITVRLLRSPAKGMIAEMELEVFAHSFQERVNKQDKICKAIREHLLQHVPELKDVRVWLVLSELGHSW